MADIWIKLGLSLISLLVGVVLGHWLAIHRDTLGRFRAAANPVRQQIINALEHENYWQALRGDPLGQVRYLLSKREQAELRHLVEEYDEQYKKAANYDYADGGRWIRPDKQTEQRAAEALRGIASLLSRPWWKLW